MHCIRMDRGLFVMDGAFGSTYIVDTVEAIDANLESLRWRPGHPDVDRLLDARRIVGPFRALFSDVDDRGDGTEGDG